MSIFWSGRWLQTSKRWSRVLELLCPCPVCSLPPVLLDPDCLEVIVSQKLVNFFYLCKAMTCAHLNCVCWGRGCLSKTSALSQRRAQKVGSMWVARAGMEQSSV